jgi:hypothetical protein
MTAKSPRALVTLLVGEKYVQNHRRYFYPGWRKYADRHGLDLVIIDRPLDESARARSRSPAWQKCLVLEHPEVRKYEQVAWVDADVMIREDAPNIFESVSAGEFGATDATCTPTREDYTVLMERLYSRWTGMGLTFLRDDSPRQYYRHFGFEQNFEGVVQSGVMVLSPELHGSILRHTYDAYEDKGEAYWHYEMRPLGYELLSKAKVRWLSPKFNVCWDLHQALHYPFLQHYEGVKKGLFFRKEQKLSEQFIRDCLSCALRNSYFLHFSGGNPHYRHLDPQGTAASS